jgi:hypothetical protein
MSQCRVRWLSYEERDLIKDLSRSIYSNRKSNYPDNLDVSKSPLYDLFLIPNYVIGSELRKVCVATDETGKILIAIGVRQIQPVPAWLLSWALSDLSSYQFARVWRQCIDFLCSYFEGIDVNEFYVLNPEDREESYRRIMKFLRDRYWTFVETTIAPGSRTNHSLYNAFMGHTTYPYQVHIRRYIKKREHHD